jgi:hypothetical protein
MTIVCDNRKARAAIYFARRLRAPTVTPVHLSDGDDLERMTRAFEQLWKEAGEYEAEAALLRPQPNGRSDATATG